MKKEGNMESQKCRKIVAMILIIFLLRTPIYSMAGWDFGDGELFDKEGEEPEYIGPIEPEPDTEPIPGQTTKKQIVIYENNIIQGNAFEDMKRESEDTSSKTILYTTNGQYDIGIEPKIQGVKVELLQNGNVISSTLTDQNGNYQFEMPKEGGTYQIRFWYGNTEGDRKSQLKYNGMDYESIAVGQNYSYYRDIIRKGKGCSQVFICIDWSASVREKGQIEEEKAAARGLIEALLSNNDNVYVGIIAFAGKAVKVKELTNDKQELLEALYEFRTTGATGINQFQNTIFQQISGLNSSNSLGTDISNAINTAAKSFINKDMENSNRSIIVVSDGAPTSHTNCEQVYRDDTDIEKQKKYEAIAIATRQDIQNFLNNKINIMTVVTESSSEEEKNIIDLTFHQDHYQNPYYHFYSVAEKDLNEKIRVEVLKNIEDTFTEGNVDYYEKTVEQTTNDDPERRKQVTNWINQKYPEFNNSTVKEVVDIIEGRNSQKENEFLTNTAMYTKVQTFTLQPVALEWGEKKNTSKPIYDGNGNVIDYEKDYYVIYANNPGVEEFYSQTEYNGFKVITQNIRCDLLLTKRDSFNLEIIKKVTGIRLISTTGDILTEAISPIAQDKSIKNIRNVTYQEGYKDDLPYKYDLAEELTNGTELHVEYTIILKNNSPIPSDGTISIIEYLPQGLRFNPDAPCITDPNSNSSQFGWQVADVETLKKEGRIDENITHDGDCLIATYTEENFANGTSLINPVIGVNGERYIKLMVSTVLSSATRENNYINEVEILGYHNKGGRRMEMATISNKMVNYENVIPGNRDQESMDIGKSIEIIIAPPTGLENRYLTVYLVFILVISLVLFFKKHQNKK